MKFKKLLGIISIIIIVMFGLMLTTSYAWYSFNEGSTDFIAVTNDDNVVVSFQRGEYISTSIAVPIKSADVDKYSEKNNFTIRVKDNKEDNEMLATISLVDISISNALQNANFKIDLYHYSTRVASVAGNSIGTSGATTKTLGSAILNNNTDNNFEVRIYILDDDSDQSALMNKTFQAKIKVDIAARLKTSLNDYSNPDINISSITIDGEASDELPETGAYTMVSTCNKGSSLSWDNISKMVTYSEGLKINDECSLAFTTDPDYEYPLLSSMPVGSYVSYVGKGGTVGDETVACQINGNASSSTKTAETEAPNSCLGQNAREDIDENGNTYGYCYSVSYKYYVTGWRIAYIDETDTSNPKAVIVSAGSPECNTITSSTANVTYIKTANAKALKYCNPDYVDGDCSCTSTTTGQCDEKSTDAWAINDTDFYYMTKAISGVGKRLTSGSSSLGDVGGTLGSTLYCYNKYSYQECGYNNDLIDNGGYYWFAARYSSSVTYGVNWGPSNRNVNYNNTKSYSFGLRSVISLSSSVYVTGGLGTIDNPYTIEKKLIDGGNNQ